MRIDFKAVPKRPNNGNVTFVNKLFRLQSLVIAPLSRTFINSLMTSAAAWPLLLSRNGDDEVQRDMLASLLMVQ